MKKKTTTRSTPRPVPAPAGNDLYQAVAEILRTARATAYRAVNFAMVEAYWDIGRKIVEEEQQGRERAEYGAALIKNLSLRLIAEFGRGFTESNLWNFRQFYLSFSGYGAPAGKLDALRRELTWTHYRLLMRVENPTARTCYMQAAAEQNWSTRILQRQITALYYERLLPSRDQTPVIDEMQALTAPLAPTPQDFIKDPYVLEFLGIPDAHPFRESELEQAIIGKLQPSCRSWARGSPSSPASSGSAPKPKSSSSIWFSTTTSSSASSSSTSSPAS